jgi:hypothetical protein
MLVARGLLLWAQAAHGPVALQAMLAADQGTLPALVARYTTWVQQLGPRLSISACAGWSDADGPPASWLPFGQPVAQPTTASPWRTRCYLPAGRWAIKGDGQGPLLGRWLSRDANPNQTPWDDHITSAGEWGVLEIAPAADQATGFRTLLLEAGQQA